MIVSLFKGNIGSVADWFSAVGTISAVFFSVYLSYEQRKMIRDNEKQKLEDEISKFNRIAEGIESAIQYDDSKNPVDIREVWKDQLDSLFVMEKELQKEIYTYDAGTVKRFIDIIVDKNDRHDIKALKDKLSGPKRKFDSIIENKEKKLKQYN